MMIHYILEEIVNEGYTFPKIVRKLSGYCCSEMELHIKAEDYYVYTEPIARLVIESYDHSKPFLVDYCPSCGQKISVECVGKQMVKRNEKGVACVPVGELIE